MSFPAYTPPWFLKNGLVMTLYTAFLGSHQLRSITAISEPSYQETIFTGAGDVPLFGWVAIPDNAHSTIIGTYGITGDLNNPFLKLLGCKAYAQGYAVVLFDWRAHGKTAELSPTLTSDGLNEGEDFVQIADQAMKMGCPAPFWFTGFSLGGQLALWGLKAAQDLTCRSQDLGLCLTDIGGAAVICPSLDSNRSLSYLVKAPLGKYLEQAITNALKQQAWQLYHTHPGAVNSAAIERINSIWEFDHELVIGNLGFPSVEAYYEASSALHLLPQLDKPTLILYAEDDPMFDPAIVPDLQAACANNPAIDLLLTRYGGHVGYLSSKASQAQAGDSDPWWAWNRVLSWCDQQRMLEPR